MITKQDALTSILEQTRYHTVDEVRQELSYRPNNDWLDGLLYALEAIEDMDEEKPQPALLLDLGDHKVGYQHLYYGTCPSCSKKLYKKTSNYCQYCGQAVRWK